MNVCVTNTNLFISHLPLSPSVSLYTYSCPHIHTSAHTHKSTYMHDMHACIHAYVQNPYAYCMHIPDAQLISFLVLT